MRRDICPPFPGQYYNGIGGLEQARHRCDYHACGERIFFVAGEWYKGEYVCVTGSLIVTTEMTTMMIIAGTRMITAVIDTTITMTSRTLA
jgi:hypothetical protein